MNIPSFNTKALSETATALATNRTDDAQTVSFSFEATNGTNTTIENATTETAIQTRLETPQKLGKKHNKNEKVF